MTRTLTKEDVCKRCRRKRHDVELRYSFGIYAGRFCVPCCSGFRDRCGLDGQQGDPRDLDEPYEEDE